MVGTIAGDLGYTGWRIGSAADFLERRCFDSNSRCSCPPTSSRLLHPARANGDASRSQVPAITSAGSPGLAVATVLISEGYSWQRKLAARRIKKSDTSELPAEARPISMRDEGGNRLGRASRAVMVQERRNGPKNSCANCRMLVVSKIVPSWHARCFSVSRVLWNKKRTIRNVLENMAAAHHS